MTTATRDDPALELLEALPSALLHGFDEQPADVEAMFPLPPFDTVGMPPHGVYFLEQAAEMVGLNAGVVRKGARKGVAATEEAEAALRYLYRQALYRPRYPMRVRWKERPVVVEALSGTYWNLAGAYGPVPHWEDEPGRRLKVMVVGKMPGRVEMSELWNLRGPSAQDLVKALEEAEAGEEELARWYCTNALKHLNPNPNAKGAEAVEAKLFQNSAPLLWAELQLLRPEFVLCLGAEAIKAILGRKEGVAKMLGRVVERTWECNRRGEPARSFTAKVMGILHPASIFHNPGQYSELASGVRQFVSLSRGGEVGRPETDLEHVCVYSERALAQEVDAAIARWDGVFPQPFAIDGEWQGEYPTEPGAYLRTIQFSHRGKYACTVVLRDEDGTPCFRPDREGEPGELAVGRQMRRLLKSTPGGRQVRVGGHFVRADLPWVFHKLGLDLREEFHAPEAPERTRDAGGFDTGYMVHAVFEELGKGGYKLEPLAARFCNIPPYNIPLLKWKEDELKRLSVQKKQNKKDRILVNEEFEGYGKCPDVVLLGEPQEGLAHGGAFERVPVKNSYACLHGDSLVQLADESWEKISSLVRRRYSGQVKALLDGRVVTARVVNWHRHDVRQKEWFKLRTASSKSGRWGLIGPAFTPDHEVCTRRGKVRVDALRPGTDAIATDELEFTPEQLSVFLGCLLGDGGFTRQNDAGVGFGFSQRPEVAAYADWKADVFRSHRPQLRPRDTGYRRYETPFGRYFRHLSLRFPTHPFEVHGDRKAVVTDELLEHLGDLGLAVWYQDDGTLATSGSGSTSCSARIYCKFADPAEPRRVVTWLTARFGPGVTYNAKSRFIQIGGAAFRRFCLAIAPYVHRAMEYKLPAWANALPERDRDFCPKADDSRLFFETVEEVVPYAPPPGRRGHGVRYCLTVEGAGNFLTQVGFVSNCYDADATFRLFEAFNGRLGEPGLLDSDRFGLDSRRSFWIQQKAAPAFLEMEMKGLNVDKAKADSLSVQYVDAGRRLTKYLRRLIRWPGFNPGSTEQRRELLFGTELNGTYDKETGKPRRLRPDWCKAVPNRRPARPELAPYQPVALGLTPLKASGSDQLWEKATRNGEPGTVFPSTDRETLGVLAPQHPYVAVLRDVRLLQQVSTQVLREPNRSWDGPGYVIGEDTYFEYDGGIMRWVMRDGRVRTHFFPIETGRCSASRPNLQNISKRREGDYQKILGALVKDEKTGEYAPSGRYLELFGGPTYRLPIRSILRATPGRVLVEADFKGAELAAIAWLAESPTMIADINRNLFLDEDDPDFLDIHTKTAVQAFKLTGPDGHLLPFKKSALPKDKKHLRVAAKPINFGIPYGMSVESAQRKIREEGVEIDFDGTAALFDGYYTSWPEVWDFQEWCKSRVRNEGWICGAHARYRRFHKTDDEKLLSEMEREGLNYPVQNCLRRGTYVLTDLGYRRIETLVGETSAAYPCALGRGDGVVIASRRKPVVRVRSRRGLPLEMSPDHVVFVYDGATGLAEKKASELRPGDWIVESHHRVEGGRDLCSDGDAYLAGYAVGDGSFSCKIDESLDSYYTVHTACDEQADILVGVYESVYGRRPSRSRSAKGVWALQAHAEFRDRMRALDFIRVRHQCERTIPDEFLTASAATRSQLLAGLFDAESECNIDHEAGTSAIFTNTSYEVCRAVYLLLSSLGFAPTLRGPYDPANPEHKPTYRVVLSGPQLVRFSREIPVRHPKWRSYADIAGRLRENSVLPPELIRRAGLALKEARAWVNASTRTSITQMISKGYGSSRLIRRLAEGAGLEDWVEFGSLRYDELVSVEATGEEDEMYDVSIVEPGAAPAFSAAGMLVHNCVADTVNTAMGKLYDYREKVRRETGRSPFDLLLQIHDAVIVECDPKDVEETADILHRCMVRELPIAPLKLDGTPVKGGPYRFEIDVEVCENWGVEMSKERRRELGIPERFDLPKIAPAL